MSNKNPKIFISFYSYGTNDRINVDEMIHNIGMRLEDMGQYWKSKKIKIEDGLYFIVYQLDSDKLDVDEEFEVLAEIKEIVRKYYSVLYSFFAIKPSSLLRDQLRESSVLMHKGFPIPMDSYHAVLIIFLRDSPLDDF